MMRIFFSNENGDRQKNDESLSEFRPYDNFLHQSFETGAFFKPLSNDQLVLIKYKNAADSDSGANSLRASQLQKRREIKSLLLFVFFLFVTIITLSQILVMHSSTSSSNFNQIKLMQEELKLMDLSIDRMLKEKHVLPIQTWIALKKYNENIKIFSSYMENLNESIFLSHENTSECEHILKLNFFYSLNDNENTKTSNLSKVLNEIDKKLNKFSNKTISCLKPLLLNLLQSLNKKYSNLHEQNYKQFAKLNRINVINETLKYFRNRSSIIEKYQPVRDLDVLMDRYQKTRLNQRSNLSLCDPQPPVLCKYFYLFFSFRIYFEFHLLKNS